MYGMKSTLLILVKAKNQKKEGSGKKAQYS